jgi:uncharacterized membrane protein (UPF0127 family)
MLKKINKLILLIIVLLIFVIFLLCFYRYCLWPFFVKDGQLIKIGLKDNFFANQKKELLVEIVKDDRLIQRGLSGRPQLETIDGRQIDGMLFIFSDTKIRQFWMKDMQFDIDICWIKDRQLLDCVRQAPKPAVEISDENLDIYSSTETVNMVIETNPNFIEDEWIEAKLFLQLF